MLSTMMLAYPKNVTINADSRPAEKVFAEIVVQSGHNYIYSPDLLKGLKVTVHAKNEPLESVLKRMFSGTGIAFTIKGNNVVLKKRKRRQKAKRAKHAVTLSAVLSRRRRAESLSREPSSETDAQGKPR